MAGGGRAPAGHLPPHGHIHTLPHGQLRHACAHSDTHVLRHAHTTPDFSLPPTGDS